jgi:hypothetical protein
MTPRVPLWLAAVSCASSAFLGGTLSQIGPARAQEIPQAVKPGKEPAKAAEDPATLSEYPYLPNRYGEAYIPSVAEWQALRVTAPPASTTRITDQFQRQHLTCFATPRGLALTLDLLPDASWKLYSGGGKFSGPPERVKADLQKAIDATMRLVRSFFPEVRDKDLSLQLYMNSERVGSWDEGKLTLVGEK